MPYTPGPWICSDDNFGNPVVATPGKLGPLGYLIAEVSSAQDNPHTPESKAEARANASLIAAAPDLLEACKYTIEQLKTVKGKAFPILPILNAIAKAEGRE
jgi:hypothetical protein